MWTVWTVWTGGQESRPVLSIRGSLLLPSPPAGGLIRMALGVMLAGIVGMAGWPPFVSLGKTRAKG